ncbi:MAG: LemA protein [Parcubacteria bacterium C7867-001]|nr:MAG: LemA protein [Parcubacteria bacterium C7867-001]
MKNIGLWIVLGVVAIFGLGSCSAYNGFVNKSTAIDKAVADVQVDVQRQANLIPSLVKVAKGYSDFERETFKEVTMARAAASAPVINVDPSKIANDPKLQEQLFAAQQQMSGSLGRLLVTMEKYPDLKSIALYQQVSDEMAGSQNRISHSRKVWNAVTADYNASIKRIPGSFIASIGGFKHKDFYTATVQGPAAEMPEISFEK